MFYFSERSTVAANCNTEMQIEMRDGTVAHFPGRPFWPFCPFSGMAGCSKVNGVSCGRWWPPWPIVCGRSDAPAAAGLQDEEGGEVAKGMRSLESEMVESCWKRTVWDEKVSN